jgi:hypothetical protein
VTAKIVREQPAGILSRRQWWSVGKACEALVVYEQDRCSIHLTDASGADISNTVAARLSKEHGRPYPTTSTIDSSFIEIPEKDLKEILRIVDEYCS